MDPTSAPSQMDQALPILSAAAQSVIQVILLAAAGAYLELSGQLGRAKRGALSTVAYRILLPALLFANVSESISADRMRTMWVMPFFAVIYTFSGAVLGWIASRLVVRPDDEFARPHVFLTCSIANYAYVPLTLLPAVFLQGALHPPGANLAGEVKRGAGMIALFVPVINLYTFGMGNFILKRHVQGRAREEAQASAASAASAEAASVEDASAPSSSAPSIESDGAYDQATLQLTDAASGLDSTATVVSVGSGVDSSDTGKQQLRGASRLLPASPSTQPRAAPGPSPLLPPTVDKLIDPFKRLVLSAPLAHQEPLARVLEVLQVFTEPPIIASMSGIAVGMIPALKALLWVTPANAAASAVVDPTSAVTSANWAADFDISGIAGPHLDRYTKLTLLPDSALRLVRNASTWFMCADTGNFDGAPAPEGPATVAGLAGQLCYAVTAGVAALPTAVTVAAAGAALGSVAVAPLGPTLASAAQVFASAVSPIVAIMMGSSIVEKPPVLSSGVDSKEAIAAQAKPAVRL